MADQLEWIIHCEYLHYLMEIRIKELCALCIQTGECFTFHVKSPPYVGVEGLLPQRDAAFKVQIERHKMCWNDGTMSELDLDVELMKMVTPEHDIYVADTVVERFLKKQEYEFVEMLDMLPPMDRLVTASSIAKSCAFHQEKYSKHCAQRKCYEIAKYLQPAFVPYLNLNIIERKCGLLTQAQNDTDEVKYGSHSLMAPLFQRLTPVDLLAQKYPPPPIFYGSRQHCMARLDGQKDEIEKMVAQTREQTAAIDEWLEDCSREASDQTA
jgi:hypothetical protein